MSISTVVFGAALLIQAGAMLSEFAQMEVTAEANVASSGGGLSALFLVGAAGIVLGVLALLGVYAIHADCSCRDCVRLRVDHQHFCRMAASDFAVGCHAVRDPRADCEDRGL